MATASYSSKIQFDLAGAVAFTTLGGVNDLSINMSRNLVDVSAMDGVSDFVKRLATLKDFPVSCSGFFDSSDATFVKINTAFLDPAQTLDAKVFLGGSTFTVRLLVESMDISASVDGAQEISFSFQSNSDLT